MVDARNDLGGQNLRLGGVFRLRPQPIEYCRSRRFDGRRRLRMKFQVTILAFNDENAGFHFGLLEGDVGQPFDVESRGDLDDLRRDVSARQPPEDPGAEVGKRLRLQLIEKNEGAQLGHRLSPESLPQFLGNNPPDFIAHSRRDAIVGRPAAAALPRLLRRALARDAVCRRLR